MLGRRRRDRSVGIAKIFDAVVRSVWSRFELLKRICVRRLDYSYLFICQRRELLLSCPPGKLAAMLFQEAVQQIDHAVGHVDSSQDSSREMIVRLQICDLVWQIPFNGLFHAFIQELGMNRGVEVAIVVCRFVQDFDVAIRRRLPVDELQQRL